MNKTDILRYIDHLKQKYNVKIYIPYKYVDGLNTKQEITSRFFDIIHHSTQFKTDFDSKKKFKKTKTSKYTIAFQKFYGSQFKTLKQKSDITGVPLDILQKVYNKGLAAYKTGHRVGATASQWGYARVHSFLTLGCTIFTADFQLFMDALQRMTFTKKKKLLSQKVKCPKTSLHSRYYKNYQDILSWRGKPLSDPLFPNGEEIPFSEMGVKGRNP
jgi:hypothetical protein